MTLFARLFFIGAARGGSVRRNAQRAVATLALFFLAGCQNTALPATEDWAAHGFMAPGPVGPSEIIGLFYEREDCKQAAKEWMERQVAGNPVFADCYPVDKT